ncbi:MAG: glycine cleavage system aminomethyltransferase GcvT [Phycisphaerales bacterium]|nr:glycine cleavage system aminomethyltransferase GcvT [Phycisphaerales bacterium]
MSKQTPLYQEHVQLGAKFTSFAGYAMPVSYTSINEEHKTVRQAVGLFDISHMGEIIVEGYAALAFLQYVTCNDVSKLIQGKIQYSCLMNEQGGTVDDLLIYCLEPSKKYLLVINAANTDKDFAYLLQHSRAFDVQLKNISEQTILLSLQGPAAMSLAQKFTSENLDLPYYSFKKVKWFNHEEVLIGNTGYTGAGGIEIFFKHEDDFTVRVWRELLSEGRSFNIKPIGLAARDTLRLEMGFSLYGHELSDSISPIEANLGKFVKLYKESFIGKIHLEKLHLTGVDRKLAGFELVEQGIPRQGYEVYSDKQKLIGSVTSGTFSPSLNKPIGICMIATAYTPTGSTIYLKIRDKFVKGIIVSYPFINKNTKL